MGEWNFLGLRGTNNAGGQTTLRMTIFSLVQFAVLQRRPSKSRVSLTSSVFILSGCRPGLTQTSRHATVKLPNWRSVFDRICDGLGKCGAHSSTLFSTKWTTTNRQQRHRNLIKLSNGILPKTHTLTLRRFRCIVCVCVCARIYVSLLEARRIAFITVNPLTATFTPEAMLLGCLSKTYRSHHNNINNTLYSRTKNSTKPRHIYIPLTHTHARMPFGICVNKKQQSDIPLFCRFQRSFPWTSSERERAGLDAHNAHCRKKYRPFSIFAIRHLTHSPLLRKLCWASDLQCVVRSQSCISNLVNLVQSLVGCIEWKDRHDFPKLRMYVSNCKSMCWCSASMSPQLENVSLSTAIRLTERHWYKC